MIAKLSKLLALVAVQSLLVGFVAVATAADMTFAAAAVCKNINPSVSVSVNHTGGLSSIEGFGVRCGIGQDQSIVDTDDDVRIYYLDLFPQFAVGDVQCFASEINADLSTIFTIPNRYSCSTPGGCADRPPSGYASTTMNYITLSDIRHGASFTTVVGCNVPGAFYPEGSTQPQFSVLQSLVLDEQ